MHTNIYIYMHKDRMLATQEVNLKRIAYGEDKSEQVEVPLTLYSHVS